MLCRPKTNTTFYKINLWYAATQTKTNWHFSITENLIIFQFKADVIIAHCHSLCNVHWRCLRTTYYVWSVWRRVKVCTLLLFARAHAQAVHGVCKTHHPISRLRHVPWLTLAAFCCRVYLCFSRNYVRCSTRRNVNIERTQILNTNIWLLDPQYTSHSVHSNRNTLQHNQTGKFHTLLTHVRLWRSQADGLSHAKSPSISTTIRTYDVLVDLLSQLANKSQTQTPATFRTYI